MTSINFWGLTASPYQLKMQLIADFTKQSWRNDLAAMEQLLTWQPFLLGQRFTLANASANGQACFNEAAFDRGEALCDGDLMGKPFRAVAKTSQVEV